MLATIHPSGMKNRLAAARLRAVEAVATTGVHLSATNGYQCLFIAATGIGGMCCGGPWFPAAPTASIICGAALKA
jgi:hypothetical protein